MLNSDSDKTVYEDKDEAKELPSSIKQVSVMAGKGGWSPLYIAQQTSLESFTPGINPLVNAAAHLLMEIVALRSSGRGEAVQTVEVDQGEKDDPALETLRARLEAEIRGFESQALASEIDNSQALAARYVLCTTLDESVSTSPQGAGGGWSSKALLSTFHNETWGGEKFFLILDRCMQQPARNLYLLELLYLLLSLGFEGRYKLKSRGPIELETLRERIYRQVRLLRGEVSPDLSKKLPEGRYKNRIYAHIPAWILTVFFLCCLSVSFWGFTHALDTRAEPLLQKFATLSSKGVSD
jgi:type VI secretion system protein ImpK